MASFGSVARRVRRWVKFSGYDRKRAFSMIFQDRYWGDRESVSGPGSSFNYTENLRRELPNLFQSFDVKSVFDAPCGDFYWMRDVIRRVPVHYIGADIVEGVLEKAREHAQDLNVEFVLHDIVQTPPPPVDLWFCRDCLFHLSHAEIFKALENFAGSEARYVMLTTHTSPRIRNRNIVTGDFRELDMFVSPFNLPRAPLAEIDDFPPNHRPRKMVLFSRAQIADALASRRIRSPRAAWA